MLFWGIIHPPTAAESNTSPYWIIGGSLLISLCMVLLIHVMTLIRTYAERYIRKRYADLVNPPGKE
jgi:TRAP-type C4-dicarboxylate transport system permease small subunit